MNYTYEELCRKIKKLGFVIERQGKGSHELRYHPTTLVHILLPRHAGKTISKGVIKEVVKSLQMTNKEFHDL